MAFHPSTCPFCSCACALLLHEEAGRLLASYPRVGAAGRSALCIRGWNCTSHTSHPDRITVPMVRGSNGLVPVSWREAVEEVAARLGDASSPALFALGPSLANEDVFAFRILASLLGASLCTTDLSGAPASRRALRQVLGRGYAIADLDTIASADLIWVIGGDLDECPQVASRVVHARRDGAAIVRFDVHATSGVDGSRMVTIPPDQFGRLPLVLQKIVFAADLAVSEARTAAGFEDLAGHWRLAPALGQRTWMPDEEALALARDFRLARRPVAILGSRWLTSAEAETHTVQLLQALQLLGAEGRVLSAVGEANSWGSLDVLGSESRPAELACRDDGLDTLFVVADDLIRRSPRPATLADTLDRLRTVVVIDRFTSSTVPFADVVLPSCTFAEIDGTTTNVFGAVQRWRRAAWPPGDCCAERVWASRIGRLMGVQEWPGTPRSWFDALRNDVEGYQALLPDSLFGQESSGQLTAVDGRVAPRVGGETRVTFAPPAADSAPVERDTLDAFPMRMVLGSHVANWSTGTISQKEELLRREMLESTIAAAPSVLERLGVKPGWPAKVLVPGGEATVTVRADRRLPPDVLVLVPLAGSPSIQLRGCYPDPECRSVGVQPVPARLERA
jgi:predicted molibdopterin-dependent oxidoreductase YjgC